MLFDVFLAGHGVAALICVITGFVAMLSPKRHGQYPRFGTVYDGAIACAFASATALSALRWPQDADLFVLGAVAVAVAFVGYAARKMCWTGWITAHSAGMGVSYIVVLTAFYVDNGPRLALWQLLPHVTYWLAPSAIGLPLVIRA